MVRVAPWVGLAALISLGSTASTSAVHAASFDCAKAGTPTEKAICKDSAVSKLDEEVAAAFKTAQAFWPAGNWKAYILTEQRNWLKDRNSICKADAACLKQDYERRLIYLKSPDLKWTGRYVAGQCPKDGIFLDATPRYSEVGVDVEIYICPNSSGNMLLQGRGKVDAAGRLSWQDEARCLYTLTFTQDTVTLSGSETGVCKPPMLDARIFRRDPAKSPFLQD
jgi:uncharacterized protein YecT (DUF1311 family)